VDAIDGGVLSPTDTTVITNGTTRGLAPLLETTHDPATGVVTLRNNGSTSVTVKTTVAAAP
jgi:hypothetical protein